jgi:hypothetical protein
LIFVKIQLEPIGWIGWVIVESIELPTLLGGICDSGWAAKNPSLNSLFLYKPFHPEGAGHTSLTTIESSCDKQHLYPHVGHEPPEPVLPPTADPDVPQFFMVG